LRDFAKEGTIIKRTDEACNAVTTAIKVAWATILPLLAKMNRPITRATVTPISRIKPMSEVNGALPKIPAMSSLFIKTALYSCEDSRMEKCSFEGREVGC
jgi:hypothetical protein